MATLSAPSLSLFATEPLRGALDHLAGRLGRTPDLPRGDGHPVVVYPGLGTSGRSTARLRATLSALGYDTHDWPGGLNRGPRGDPDAFIDELAQRLERVVDARGTAATLVGWSLGGVYAREIARRRADLVRAVVTLGSPVCAGPEATRARPLYRLLNGNPARLDERLRARIERPLRVPHASVWSRDDGIVAWQACVARGRGARNLEVPGVSHLGLVAHPEAIARVAQALASARPPRAAAQPGPGSRSRHCASGPN
jgi:pimeloyl-ACP methyl ester carboxylesterase